MDIRRMITLKKITIAVLLSILLILIPTVARASVASQPWSSVYGGTGDDGFNKVINTSDGGYAAAGYTGSYGNGTTNQSSNVWLVKTDASGHEQWNKTYGGTGQDVGYGVVQTQDGGYAIAGYTTSYGYGNGSENGTGNGSMKMWLIRTDASGHELWNRTYGNGYQDSAFSIAKTSDGGFILTGFTFLKSKAGWDLYLVKTDADGNEQWNKTYGGSLKDAGHYVEQTSDGGYIVTGFSQSYGIRGGDFYHIGSENLWLLKTDASGNELWNKTYGGLDYDDGFFVQQLQDGGYIVAGTTESFDQHGNPIDAFSETADIIRAYLIRTDASGNELWNKTFGGSMNTAGYSMVVRPDGYVIGGTTFTSNGTAFFAIKAGINGSEVWGDEYGGILDNYCYSIMSASDGGYLLAGFTDAFGDGKGGFLLKIGDDGSGPTSVSKASTGHASPGLPVVVYIIAAIVAASLIGALYFGYRWYMSR